MTIENKLRSIYTIKNNIAKEISNKGIYIDDNTPFSEYPSKIASIINNDTSAPIIYSFNLIINSNRSATFSGKTEKGVSIILRNPNNQIIPITIDNDGNFISITDSPAIEGVYTLIISDSSGNTTVDTKQVILTIIQSDPIKKLFTTSTEGVYYDINDLSTLFQDAGGNMPVTTVGQTIGCIKDKSGNNYNLIQPTVSRQPKLIKDPLTNSYGLSWDGIDDMMFVSIPNIISTTVHMFYSQRFHELSKSSFTMTLAETLVNPQSSRSLFFTIAYDPFYSLLLRYYRSFNNLGQKSGIKTLRNVFGGKHAIGQIIGVYYNRTYTAGEPIAHLGIAWQQPSPSFISITGTGVTYKILVIGRDLTTTETNMIQDTMNIDVGAW